MPLTDIGYPFLQEALVTAVTDELFDYILSDNGQILPVPHSQLEISAWKRKAERIENHYSKRMGMILGPVEVLVHVSQLAGLRRTDEGAMVKEFQNIPGMEADFALQTVVDYHIVSEDQRFLVSTSIHPSIYCCANAYKYLGERCCAYCGRISRRCKSILLG